MKSMRQHTSIRWSRLAGAGWVALVAAVGLGGCSSTPEKPKPTVLEQPAPSALRVQPGWSLRLGGEVKLPLQVASQAGQVIVASSNGTVVAVDAATGREVWRASVGAELSAGVGSDGRYVAVATRAGELVLIEAGEVRWRQRLPVRALTTPLVAGARVFVYAADRSVHAFDAQSGGRLWSQQRPGDPLTLSQPGVLLAVRDTLVVGQGARLAGLDPNRGSLRWEVPVASPRGTNEVERLADLVGPAARSGDLVCVRAFQSALGCVNTEQGNLAWSKSSSGSLGLALDDRLVYGVDSTDRIVAYRRANGEAAWTSERFRFRGLSAPASTGRQVVVGDAEGYLHWLSAEDGRTLARLATDGSPIVAQPVVAAGWLLAVTRHGGIYAYKTD